MPSVGGEMTGKLPSLPAVSYIPCTNSSPPPSHLYPAPTPAQPQLFPCPITSLLSTSSSPVSSHLFQQTLPLFHHCQATSWEKLPASGEESREAILQKSVVPIQAPSALTEKLKAQPQSGKDVPWLASSQRAFLARLRWGPSEELMIQRWAVESRYQLPWGFQSAGEVIISLKPA